MRVIAFFILALTSSAVFAGYDIHITRKAFWADEDGPTISISDWEKYIAQDPQITPDTKNTKNDFLVSLGTETFPIWFNPILGELYTKNPSDDAIKKMIDVASRLGANAQGDDGELYPPAP
ncbi:hypothetical protein GHO29_22240 [Pseudomonas helleri]|uniref:Uncharacterized protein n=1 Tax=Pseudomonas helleri TaxID=1608996 RepID=A0A7X1Y4E1_9PSED|nr:hypothetical protein [Pseudomonas helleri]MQU29190.1 hypothetical protein [Pseudomonas helleri]